MTVMMLMARVTDDAHGASDTRNGRCLMFSRTYHIYLPDNSVYARTLSYLVSLHRNKYTMLWYLL